MKLISKREIKKEICFDISVEDTNCFFANGILVHNSNAGIRIKDGEVVAQSRTQLLSLTNDNAGFARWVESTKDYWKNLNLSDCTVFGEWCGPGIMKGTAINQIPTKTFVVFAIDGLKVEIEGTLHEIFVTEPETIDKMLHGRPSDVHVLPWYGEPIKVDFTNEAVLRKTAGILNTVVDAVEPCDPWVKDTFGISGTAEGVVYYPDSSYRDVFSNFAFKAKGEKHRVVKAKEAVQVDPEVAASIDQFVSMFVTEARMEQGLAAIGGSQEMKNMGPFLKWVSSDIFKESEDELEASGLTWDQVNKSVQHAARNWFMAKNKSI
jgi:hypothetical protein